MRRFFSLSCALLPMLLLVACTASNQPPSSSPGMTGSIEEISAARILVRGERAPGSTGDRLVWTTITGKTLIAKAQGKSYSVMAASDLKVSAKIQVWFVGPLAESYPEQGTASYIFIKS